MENIDIGQLNEEIREKSAFLGLIQQEIGKSIIGQKYMTERLMIALLCQGHILLEGLPGLAKTLAIKSLADAISVKFSRIQFTPDLLPADIVGTMIYNQAKGSFEVRKGPVFANFLLADEINRAPAKVQSALLQAMQERMITIGDTTYPLQEPFMVMATQNPIEQEGTYPLPEAQVDRFMLKVKISYPEYEEERQIIRQNLLDESPKINAVVEASSILSARKLVKRIYMDEKIEKYILDIVFASRQPEKFKLNGLQNLISFGASPRASISLAMASKAYAFMRNRGFVIPEDVRAVCYDVLRHRIGITYEAEAENLNSDAIIGQIISKIEVP
ncbi:MAG: MoxR family ATPase [Chitinophagales bacterium]|nr:MoxR family ATPase [Chitinophagales bacterium]